METAVDAPRTADARRADRAGRDERAQRPLLHDQGPGAAADPARALAATTPPTTWPGSSWCRSCRATASRCRRSRGTSPASPPTPRPRTSPCTARCSRPGRPSCPSRSCRAPSSSAGPAAPSATTTSRPWRRSASSRPLRARPVPGRRSSQLGGRPRPARPRLPDRGRPRRRRGVRRPRARDRRGALRAVPHQGLAGLQGAGRLARADPARSSSGSSRSRSPSLVQAYEAGMDETRRENIAKRAR